MYNDMSMPPDDHFEWLAKSNEHNKAPVLSHRFDEYFDPRFDQEGGGRSNGTVVSQRSYQEEFAEFLQLANLLHRAGNAAYIWQCSEGRKAKTLKSGEVVWSDAAYKRTLN